MMNNRIDIPTKPDLMTRMCIKQGYVPDGCQLAGALVMTFIREGKKPCEGCNMKCQVKSKKERYL